jgi:hypothetical protein
MQHLGYAAVAAGLADGGQGCSGVLTWGGARAFLVLGEPLFGSQLLIKKRSQDCSGMLALGRRARSWFLANLGLALNF